MSNLFLAAEGGGSGGAVPVLILVVALVGFAVAYVVVGPGKRRRGPKRHGDIPLAMRPYHSDEELETTGMERAMSWGVAFAVFAALFLPLYWVIEPGRIDDRREAFYEADVAAGRALFQDACASCHGVNLEGGSAPNPNPDIDAPWPAPALDNIVARYAESEVVDDPFELIIMTLENGRPGTPMQAFGVGAGGQYSDNQLQQIATYIYSVQTGEIPEIDAQAFVGRSGDDLFAEHCARCHGAELEGYVGPQLLNLYERYGVDITDPDQLANGRGVVEEAVIHGRRVPGQALMPPFEQVLTADAIEQIIDHIEERQVTGGPRFGQLGGDPVVGDDEDDATETDQ
ncbi:cytochrome c [Nitriliruptoraceae bacterium ZYF776]|nr:cytochrome c [Profundirhabdus halotolerans]